MENHQLSPSLISDGCREFTGSSGLQLNSSPCVWGSHTKHDLKQVVNAVYEEIVSWRKNVFPLRSGAAGKSFVRGAERLLRAWNSDSQSRWAVCGLISSCVCVCVRACARACVCVWLLLCLCVCGFSCSCGGLCRRLVAWLAIAIYRFRSFAE